MAISGKYGKVDIPKIGADEPVFILRAQDSLAGTAIEMYRLLAASHGRPLANSWTKRFRPSRNGAVRRRCQIRLVANIAC
jgi:hypothetical protein